MESVGRIVVVARRWLHAKIYKTQLCSSTNVNTEQRHFAGLFRYCLSVVLKSGEKSPRLTSRHWAALQQRHFRSMQLQLLALLLAAELLSEAAAASRNLIKVTATRARVDKCVCRAAGLQFTWE